MSEALIVLLVLFVLAFAVVQVQLHHLWRKQQGHAEEAAKERVEFWDALDDVSENTAECLGTSEGKLELLSARVSDLETVLVARGA